MSKTINALKKAVQEKESKYTTAIHRHEVEGANFSSAPSESTGAFSSPESSLSAAGDSAFQDTDFEGKKSRFIPYQTILLIALMIIGMISVGLNIKTFVEIGRARHSSSGLSQEIKSQKDKIRVTEKSVADLRAQYETQIAELQEKIQTLTVSLRKAHTDVADLTTQNRSLQKTITDIKQSYHNLDIRYKRLAETVEKLKSASVDVSAK